MELLPFVNNVDYILQCTQINEFESGNKTRKRFDGNHFLLLPRSRAEHMKKWEMSIMFFAPKLYAPIHIPASETSLPLATYVARARPPRDFVARNYLLASLESDK